MIEIKSVFIMIAVSIFTYFSFSVLIDTIKIGGLDEKFKLAVTQALFHLLPNQKHFEFNLHKLEMPKCTPAKVSHPLEISTSSPIFIKKELVKLPQIPVLYLNYSYFMFFAIFIMEAIRLEIDLGPYHLFSRSKKYGWWRRKSR